MAAQELPRGIVLINVSVSSLQEGKSQSVSQVGVRPSSVKSFVTMRNHLK